MTRCRALAKGKPWHVQPCHFAGTLLPGHQTTSWKHSHAMSRYIMCIFQSNALRCHAMHRHAKHGRLSKYMRNDAKCHGGCHWQINMYLNRHVYTVYTPCDEKVKCSWRHAIPRASTHWLAVLSLQAQNGSKHPTLERAREVFPMDKQESNINATIKQERLTCITCIMNIHEFRNSRSFSLALLFPKDADDWAACCGEFLIVLSISCVLSWNLILLL